MTDFEPSGLLIDYFYICKRKLYLYFYKISFENRNDAILIGKEIEESYFKDSLKSITVDNSKIDFITIEDKVVVHEIKKSRALESAHIWQVKYYIYQLRQKGINSEYGIIHYPLLKRKISVNFNEIDQTRIQEAIEKIREVLSLSQPPSVIKKPFCSKCAYYEYCYI